MDTIKNIRRSAVRHLALSHIVGPDLTDGVNACRHAFFGGWRSTLCRWEHPEDSTEQVIREYMKALHAVRDLRIDCRFSLKLPAIRYDRDLMKEVLNCARLFDLPLQFDAQDHQSTDRSLQLLEYAVLQYSNIGYTLPARWNRSTTDARRILEMNIPVRLVKGQWSGPETRIGDIRSRFLSLVDVFQGSRSAVTIASHDRPLVMESLRRLTAAAVPTESEQMFGLPWVKDFPAEIGSVPRRMYIPYGCPYLPYDIHFAFETPVVMEWILRDVFVRRQTKIRRLKEAHRGADPYPFPQQRSPGGKAVSTQTAGGTR